MGGKAQWKDPLACTAQERAEFERLVRQGFDGSDAGLPERIRCASRLAFHVASGAMIAIAALKMPGEEYVRRVFEIAEVSAEPVDFRLELGWVFVVPGHRGKRISEKLCRELLVSAPTSCVLATTRTSNVPMRRILRDLGFRKAGRPYPRGEEMLEVFLRYPA